jgi:hypothetical protein
MTYNLTELPYMFQTWCRAVEILVSSSFFEQMTFEQMTHLRFLIFYSRVQTNVHTFGKCTLIVAKQQTRTNMFQSKRQKKRKKILNFFFYFGLSQLTTLQFILYHVAGFYEPFYVPIIPPSHLQDYSICNNARLEFSTNFVPSFDLNEWCLKNGLHSGGFELIIFQI